MDNLFNIDDYVLEKKVTVKRRYTDKHPARKMSTAARVRGAIFTAMGDGVLTEEEMNNVLQEISAHRRWLKRNLSLFNISEDETGIKSYSLSVFGNRVRQKTIRLNETKTLNEAEAVTPEMLTDIHEALPDLEKLIRKHSGAKVKLKASIDGNRIHIYSDNLIGQISPIGRTVFSEIQIAFWGGDYIPKGSTSKINRIWFNPKTSYFHPSGGSNGTSFIWDGLNFDLENKKWREGNLLRR